MPLSQLSYTNDGARWFPRGSQKGPKQVIVGQCASSYKPLFDLTDIRKCCLSEDSCDVAMLCLCSNVEFDAIQSAYVEEMDLVVQAIVGTVQK